MLSIRTLLDIRLPIFFRVQNPESMQNGNGNRHTVQAVQERMQNGHGSGQSELQRMRNGNGNRAPSESEVVMVNGLRNAQKSPVASTSQGKSLLDFLILHYTNHLIARFLQILCLTFFFAKY